MSMEVNLKRRPSWARYIHGYEAAQHAWEYIKGTIINATLSPPRLTVRYVNKYGIERVGVFDSTTGERVQLSSKDPCNPGWILCEEYVAEDPAPPKRDFPKLAERAPVMEYVRAEPRLEVGDLLQVIAELRGIAYQALDNHLSDREASELWTKLNGADLGAGLPTREDYEAGNYDKEDDDKPPTPEEAFGPDSDWVELPPPEPETKLSPAVYRSLMDFDDGGDRECGTPLLPPFRPAEAFLAELEKVPNVDLSGFVLTQEDIDACADPRND